MLHKKNLLWLALVMAGSAQAQGDQRLSDLQVTANRLPQSQSDVLASTTVIDRDDIERSQAGSIIDLLQGRAGIEIAQNGPPGTLSSLFMRGTQSDHSLVLVDGVRINSATSGGASLEMLPLEAIERVEIVRGPRAAAYGADAIGGVIQVFTRHGTASGTQGGLKASTGSDSTQRQSAWVATGDDDTRLNASLFHRDGDGFNAKQADDSGERDGFEREGAQLGLSHRVNDDVEVSVNALRQNFENEYDNCSFPASQDCVTKGYLQSFGGQLDVQLQPDWQMLITAGHFDEQREERYSGERQSLTETHRDEVGLQHRFTRDNGVDVLGVDYRHDNIDFNNRAGESYQKDSRENYGIYGMMQRTYGAHELSGSLRYDDDSLFGNKATGNAAYAYQITQNQRLGVSYGTAFKAPSLSDMYGTYNPNPDLDAEESKSLEAFWAFSQGDWKTRVTAFQNRIEDMIVYTGASPNGTYRNIDEARIRGLELSGGWHGERLVTQLSITFQDPEVRSWSDNYAGISVGDRLLNRSEHYARLDTDYKINNEWSVGSTLWAFSERTSYGGQEVGGYGVVDLRTAWQVTSMVELSAKVENAFDKEYQLVDGYNTQDRYVEGGVTLRF
ncbi:MULTISPECIES: TonB-dependent receptor domain-containing protein [Chromohalobacter]|uniref:TonB-dependent receptor n=2 Tax=Chromohalobacter TaxID=42054 RepID=A0A9X3AW94_9GAMM|nr:MULTISPECIES: TonB-dependent receptor [Chromohalobacter]MCK0753111.1 TonB-dependent receptor [Chromohalobacter japonicus]MCK0764249.1 TonB-dependent receptor [Chromohalobacter beijerinckii]MCT8503937.1 TonB-dependent receptor [Chromohalobacter moromii]